MFQIGDEHEDHAEAREPEGKAPTGKEDSLTTETPETYHGENGSQEHLVEEGDRR